MILQGWKMQEWNHPCIFDRADFSTPAFSVSPFGRQTFGQHFLDTDRRLGDSSLRLSDKNKSQTIAAGCNGTAFW